MKTIYTATATASGGRNGTACTDDGALQVKLVRPRELGGDGAAGTNPEQLFACGYGACFASTLDVVARTRKLTLTRNEVTAHIGLCQREEGGYVLSAKLDILLGGVDGAVAEDLVREAHVICPYSNSISATVPVELAIGISE